MALGGPDDASVAAAPGPEALPNGDVPHAGPLQNGDAAGHGQAGKKARLTEGEKARLRRKKKKAQKQAQREERGRNGKAAEGAEASAPTLAADVEVEYVSAPREYEDLLHALPAASLADAPAGAPAAPSEAATDEPPGEQPSTTGGGLGFSAPSTLADADLAEEGLPTGGLGLGAAAAGGLSGFTSSGNLPSQAADVAGAGPGLASATPVLGSDYAAATPYGGSGLGLGAGDTPAGAHGAAPDPLAGTRLAGLSMPKAENPYADFERVFSKFATAEELTGKAAAREAGGEEGDAEEEDAEAAGREGEGRREGREGSADEEAAEGEGKRKKRQESRMKVAELKQACPRPEVVEIWDVTAQDPRFLVYLKAYRNTVPVPRHWSQKRKYLQGKRGLEKPAFKLPDFLESTGIGEMRQAYHEKEEAKRLKQKQQDKTRPKTGKLDIDYQVLHDAFFKHQTKPNLSRMGDLYYEGKEFEAKLRGSKPGVLSEGLRGALGMTEASPPPWLINMQRYGPPPSYPELKVPGLNAPIPPGASFGYHPGGWGKPPVDEQGRPLYGDVFGQAEGGVEEEPVDKGAHWGDLESEEEVSDEEEEEEEAPEPPEGEPEPEGIASVASGYGSSIPSGIETPDALDLRKAKGTPVGEPRPLYQVLPEQQATVAAGQLMGSDHTYVLPGASGIQSVAPPEAARPGPLRAPRGPEGARPGDVEVAIDPAELEGLDEAQVRQLYETRLQQQRQAASGSREDFSDLVAAKARQQKRKAQDRKEADKGKKAKESFKF